MKLYQFYFELKPRPLPWEPGKLAVGFAPMGHPLYPPREPFSDAARWVVKESDLCIYKAMAHDLK
ncbi:hypothetical protein CPT_Maja_099 [Burkholderia phage Maja]|uniref:Uncharacterized protein n=1 Tax=Burkholderia phage Maja TaxID=2767571 RepID=A0A7S6R8X8_9CAUD|nr:hypothetical protein CPT_Maja_099 [Burkholderia phage Maja]